MLSEKPYGLRIKRKYLDLILSGDKTIEYRATTARYRGLRDAKRLQLHYQRSRRVLCDVVSVRIIPLPDRFLDDESLNATGYVYAVMVDNPREVFV